MTGTVVVTPAPAAATSARRRPGSRGRDRRDAGRRRERRLVGRLGPRGRQRGAEARERPHEPARAWRSRSTTRRPSTTAAIAGRKTTPIGKAEAAKPGRGSMPWR